MGTTYPASFSKVVRSLAPADYGATAPTTASAIIDTLGYRFARFDFNIGVVAGTGLDCVIQQDSDPAFGSGVTTGLALPTITTANDDTIHSVTLETVKVERYLRAIWTFNAVTISPLSVTCTLFSVHDTAHP